MKFVSGVVVFVVLCSIFAPAICAYPDITDNTLAQKWDTLRLVHVLFRHGNRTAEPTELYAKDPYLNKTYYPYGLGQLTNAGKQREYQIGKKLRDRFDHFLGPDYYPTIVDARSTDYNRTKMSLLLALAGLFPPKGNQVWGTEITNWQPVPYNYVSRPQDELLIGVSCPNYLTELDRIKKSPYHQSQLKKYAETMKYIAESTGNNITDFEDVYNLYFGLVTEDEYGLPLPEWTKKVYPEKMTEMAIKYYDEAMATMKLRKIGVGYFLKKIMDDTEAVLAGKGEEGRKIYLYSAHENNVAELLLVLDIFRPPHIPTYGSYVILEVHETTPGVYAFKIFYDNYTTKEPRLLRLPSCGQDNCEISKFKSIVSKYFPEEGLCGNKKCD